MRYCSNCGSPIPETNARHCPNCGQSVSPEQRTANQTAAQSFDPAAQIKKGSAEHAPMGLDQATFLKKYSQGRKLCIAAAVLGYISAGTTFLLSFTDIVAFVNLYSLIDVILLVVLSLLIHLLRSRIASILLLIYSVISVLIVVIGYGQFGGWLVVVAGVLAVSGSFQSAKELKAYLARSQPSVPLS